MKYKEMQEAIRLRQQDGLPIREIAKKLGVAKSSVSLWVRDVELSPQQKEVLLGKNPVYNRQLEGGKARKEASRKEREKFQEEGRDLVKERTSQTMLALCAGLYWGEGSKNKNVLSITNTDPQLLLTFISFLKQYFDVQPDQIAISIQLQASNEKTLEEVEKYWLETLSLPSESLRKSMRKASPTRVWQKNSKYPNGICRLTICKTQLVQQVFGVIKELANVQDDRWLD
jgi:transcriptional regulator with XRE-family HTH domain